MGTHLLHCRYFIRLDLDPYLTHTQLGGATCIWAFILWTFLPDTPSAAWFLKERERLIAVKRVSENETGIKNKSFNLKQIAVAFWDPKSILLFISVFAA